MDINMPLKDGFEVVSELRDSDDLYFKTLPVIAYTASIMFDEAENILESGFTSYLSKPVNVNILINEIKKHSLVSVK
ncbi:response regulator [Pseudopedobacter beijingensis]|uniref:Response regulator n=1 Tax=Pseudopedobacter beijingensis TaxID=1207056 RepID=A0ABW4I8C4_9SPHI